MSEERTDSSLDRRLFLKGTGAAAAAFAATGTAALAHNGGREEIRVGLVGCGGRGTGAAVNALKADPKAKLVAMGDAFADRLQRSRKNLQKSKNSAQVAVDDDHCFSGFDAYQKVIESCDVVLLCSTPHFRPKHLAAAIAAGKHVFCEKPVAVDAPGIRSVMETSRKAKEKGLNLVSGLCYRYHDAKQETIKRIHEGAVGDIVALQCTYNTGGLWHRGHKPEWSDMEHQIRNWLYFTWLSGDHIAEQSIHSIDKILWAMGDVAPKKVTASGGRSTRTEEKYGNVYDHFNTVFEWEGGLRLFHSCRQWAGTDGDVSDYVYGTKGTALIQHHQIRGDNAWRFKGRPNNMYDAEHRALFSAIREGRAINNGDYMCKSTLMAIMGRMAAYTGKTLTWEQALNSKQSLSPQSYTWGDLDKPVVAQPGKTPFV